MKAKQARWQKPWSPKQIHWAMKQKVWQGPFGKKNRHSEHQYSMMKPAVRPLLCTVISRSGSSGPLQASRRASGLRAAVGPSPVPFRGNNIVGCVREGVGGKQGPVGQSTEGRWQDTKTLLGNRRAGPGLSLAPPPRPTEERGARGGGGREEPEREITVQSSGRSAGFIIEYLEATADSG